MDNKDLYDKGYNIGVKLWKEMIAAAEARIKEFPKDDQDLIGDGVYDAFAEQ